MALITDPFFYAVAIPSVLLMGVSKSGFGTGFGSLAVPLMALAVSVPDAAAIMKLGSNFEKVRRVLVKLGLADRALYVERATMAAQRIVPFAEIDPAKVPYFSMILVPGARWQG